MFLKRRWALSRAVLALTGLFVLLNSCVEAVPPEFDFEDDLIIIDALASTAAGTSYAKVQQTSYEFGLYRSKDISGCTVTLINEDTQEREQLFESEGSYIVDASFRVQSGSKWYIEVQLPNGQTFRSTTETAPEEVSITNIKENFNPEMLYDEGTESYTSGHEIRINFDDPENQRNFFFYQYRAYEQEVYCMLCEYGVYRNGECLSQINNPALTKEYYTYLCDVPCWKISYNQDINIFSDEFTNGKSVENLLVAKVPFTSKQDVLVEVLQLNISQDAYKHYRTIKDLVDNNSGFNAPLPAALIGNFTDLSNPEQIALGRFTAAAAVTETIFIRRSLRDEPLSGDFKSPQPEILGDPVPQPLTYIAPCIESIYRTSDLDAKRLRYFKGTAILEGSTNLTNTP
ncbi:MAG: DUF4249 domain-containing protein [Flavobacteriaceae bacterium]